MIKLAILLIICCKVSTFYIEKLNLKFFCYSNNLNRNIDAALKLKRLRQLKSEGKRYTDYLNEKSVLENEPFTQLAKDNQMHAFHHNGFWQPMDTYREFKLLNDLWDSGKAPWKVWR